MIWIIIVVVIGIIIFRFISDLSKDSNDLQGKTVAEKFNIIVNMINAYAFNGDGEIIKLSNRECNIYQDDQNQIINLLYSTGCLTITWRYKYFQRELIHKKQFFNVRNINTTEQQNIGEQLINEVSIAIEMHIIKISGDM
ncbi:MAG: hypothetical protein QM727_12525 [Niabella sp.]